jgi:hypothetical protein
MAVPRRRVLRLPHLGSRVQFHRYEDYLELVDWTGRIVRPDKRCALDSLAARFTVDFRRLALLAGDLHARFAAVFNPVTDFHSAPTPL